jgi:hypothetical protein
MGGVFVRLVAAKHRWVTGGKFGIMRIGIIRTRLDPADVTDVPQTDYHAGDCPTLFPEGA